MSGAAGGGREESPITSVTLQRQGEMLSPPVTQGLLFSFPIPKASSPALKLSIKASRGSVLVPIALKSAMRDFQDTGREGGGWGEATASS